MASRLVSFPETPRSASVQIVVYADTAISTVADLLRAAGGAAAEVMDPRGTRAGLAMAQDVFEANRLGAGREPISRLVVWSESMRAVRRIQRPPLRLVRQPEPPSARAKTGTAATDAPEPLRLLELRRRD